MNEEGEIFTVDSSKIQSALDSYASNLSACPFYSFLSSGKPGAEISQDSYDVAGIQFYFSRVTFNCPFYKENKCTSKKEKSLDDFLV